jgi:hypothetical protein
MKGVFHFFDKLEDKIRAGLSHSPVLYALIGGTAIVLFWRGVWMTADTIPFLTGPVSILISIIVLLITGLFVSFFVGDSIIISGLKKEKKLDEKIASEIKTETDVLSEINKKLDHVDKKLEDIKK